MTAESAYPFVFPRTVAWGDCDPARLLFVPRLLAYVVEAEHAALLGAGLEADELGRLARVTVEMELTAPISFADELDLRFGVVHLGRTSARYAFRIERAGELCAQVRVSVVQLIDGRPEPIVGALRAALERYAVSSE